MMFKRLLEELISA